MTSYLVLKCPPEAEEGYQYRMLAVNRIQGLLPCSFRTIDGEHFLYYGITSCQSLARMYDHRVLGGRELKKILYSIAGMIRVLSEYLLDAEKMLLDPEYIFYDPEKERYCFTYYPESGSQTGTALFEYFADRMDGDDQVTSMVVYRLCELAETPNFVLRESILDHEYRLAEGGDVDEEHIKGEQKKERQDVSSAEKEEEELPEDDFFEEEEPKRHAGKRTLRKKAEKREGKAAGEGRKKEVNFPGLFLGAAIVFLLAAAGLWMSGYWLIFTEEESILVRAGILGSLVLAILAAVIGVVLFWKKGKRDYQKEREEQEEQRKNAMSKTEDFC